MIVKTVTMGEKVLQLQLFQQCKLEVGHMYQYNHDYNAYSEKQYSCKWINKRAIYEKSSIAERQTLTEIRFLYEIH